MICPNCSCQFKIATCKSINPKTGNQCGQPSGHYSDLHSHGQGSYIESWRDKMTTGVGHEILNNPNPIGDKR